MPRKSAKPKAPQVALNFAALVEAVRQVHEHSATAASRAVNVSLTLRNWAIGCYIVEYEQNGADRAEYGEGMMDRLAEALRRCGVPASNRQRLYAYVGFYRTYPQIAEVIPAAWATRFLPMSRTPQTSIVRSLTGQSADAAKAKKIVRSATGISRISGQMLADRLSYTHLELLAGLETPLKRAFYEIECIRGNWSVRALKRQIATLYFERSGLSTDKEKLAAMAHAVAEKEAPKLAIRDPYIFEFLGLNPQEAAAESDVEDALLDNLQDFLLELGHGFCLEARQKSIVIGRTRGFVDLVFYHRILRCHLLIELKVDEFRHEHLGQLNTYVTWYRKHMMAQGDSPPIGLLLCTQKDHALVEYAVAAIDSRLFVSKYQLELPSKEDLQRFLEEKRREMGNEW
mgnify:CR=1 FL=1